MNTNKQLTKGNKMRKTIFSLLVILSMSTALTTPSQAGWSNGPGGLFWCNNNGGCVKK
tara:strand:+ start:2332 stop:2505 length:174 start_codon:yes stop_codon:yes gene_type:complete